MDGPLSFEWLRRFLRRSKRDKALQQAATWPVFTAKLLSSTVVPKDLLAEEGTAFQEFQIESAFYFTHEGGYYGGHLRSTPLSDSEAHRLIAATREDTSIRIRYNPRNPDENHTLAADNPNALPFTIWSS
jgi:hypothetical protein